MPVSFRNIIVGLAGLATLFIGGPIFYEFYGASEQKQTAYNYQPAADTVRLVDAVTKQPTEPYQANCDNPDNPEKADICAQWAAVEQVAESNRLTSVNVRIGLLALFLTGIGTALLVWTLAETRETSRRELRAYVFLEGSAIFLADGSNPNAPKNSLMAGLTIKNSGTTPAFGLKHWGWSR